MEGADWRQKILHDSQSTTSKVEITWSKMMVARLHPWIVIDLIFPGIVITHFCALKTKTLCFCSTPSTSLSCTMCSTHHVPRRNSQDGGFTFFTAFLTAFFSVGFFAFGFNPGCFFIAFFISLVTFLSLKAAVAPPASSLSHMELPLLISAKTADIPPTEASFFGAEASITGGGPRSMGGGAIPPGGGGTPPAAPAPAPGVHVFASPPFLFQAISAAWYSLT
mmetsp:Transcript_31135/g.43316  ORF Transcript_31135/g.43316 Transcript_31135/m.43316 type:complete len:222 (+) Transcript_31135:732-1397(+)